MYSRNQVSVAFDLLHIHGRVFWKSQCLEMPYQMPCCVNSKSKVFFFLFASLAGKGTKRPRYKRGEDIDGKCLRCPPLCVCFSPQFHEMTRSGRICPVLLFLAVPSQTNMAKKSPLFAPTSLNLMVCYRFDCPHFLRDLNFKARDLSLKEMQLHIPKMFHL